MSLVLFCMETLTELGKNLFLKLKSMDVELLVKTSKLYLV